MEAFTLKRGEVVKVNVTRITKNFTWVRCVVPTKEKISLLSEISKIPVEELRDSMQEEERPKVVEKKHLEIIYRSPFVHNGEIVTLPIYFYIFRNLLITIEKKSDISLEDVAEQFRNGKSKSLLKKGHGNFIYYILDAINDRFLEHIDQIAEGIDVFENERELTDKGVEKIYDASVVLSYFNRALTANIEVLNNLRKSKYKPFNAKDRENFSELFSNALQVLDTENVQRDIITNLFNLQSVMSSNRLNNYMKKLASLALIIMIPTLISGAYGMNFLHIPLREHPYGFHITLLVMIGFTALVTIIFMKSEWL